MRARPLGPGERRGDLPHQRAHRRAPGPGARRTHARGGPGDAPPAGGAGAYPARGGPAAPERERVSAATRRRGRQLLVALLLILLLVAGAALGAGYVWLLNEYRAPGPAAA